MNRRTVLALATTGLVGCVDRSSRNSRVTSRNDNETVRSKVGDDEPPTGDPAIAGTFDDFTDFSAWSVLAGSLEADKRHGTTDSPSAKLIADASTDRVVIARELSEPVDCSDVAPGLVAAADQMMVPTIQLFDASGDRVDFRRGLKGDLPVLAYNFGATDVVGDPDLSAITEIRIAVWVGEATKRLWIDELRFSQRSDRGKVMVQFDDGFQTDYTEGFPILDRHGYPAVTFVNPGRIGADDRLSLRQADRLKEEGWTVANHGYSHAHLEELTPSEQERVIADGATWLRDHGFENGARYFAYPFGEFDATTLELVADHHDLAFWGGRGVHGSTVNPLLCPRIGDPSSETAIELLDRAAELGGIATLFYHDLTGDQLSAFEATVDRIHELESAGRLEVVTPADIAATLSV